jgi:hypothetical protein
MQKPDIIVDYTISSPKAPYRDRELIAQKYKPKRPEVVRHSSKRSGA